MRNLIILTVLVGMSISCKKSNDLPQPQKDVSKDLAAELGIDRSLVTTLPEGVPTIKAANIDEIKKLLIKAVTFSGKAVFATSAPLMMENPLPFDPLDGANEEFVLLPNGYGYWRKWMGVYGVSFGFKWSRDNIGYITLSEPKGYIYGAVAGIRWDQGAFEGGGFMDNMYGSISAGIYYGVSFGGVNLGISVPTTFSFVYNGATKQYTVTLTLASDPKPHTN